MANILISINCPACGGKSTNTRNTEAPFEENCVRCETTGYIPWGRLELDSAVFDDILDKLDAIIAEQAAQRADLTAALTQTRSGTRSKIFNNQPLIVR